MPRKSQNNIEALSYKIDMVLEHQKEGFFQVNARLDKVNGQVNTHTEKIECLQQSDATQKGTMHGIKWVMGLIGGATLFEWLARK